MSYLGPLSIKLSDNCPPPKCLDVQQLNQDKQFDLKSVLKDFQVVENGELRIINDDFKARHKGIMSGVLV